MDKATVIRCVFDFAQEKYKRLRLEYLEVSESVHEDQKSSMGDKYETSREMGQQTLHVLSKQLLEIEKQLEILKNPIFMQAYHEIVSGSIAQLDDNLLLLFGVSLGSVPMNPGGGIVQTISTSAPVYKECLHKKKGDLMAWKGRIYTIRWIL